jgi:hypothetical protein
MHLHVDVSFDCRNDAGGRDPDSHSPTLRRYHQRLWSKPLPCGKHFTLDISGPKPYLVHRSDLGDFELTSDSITHTYSRRAKQSQWVPLLPEHLRQFATSGAWVVSECVVFPGRRMDGKNTINGARGMNRQIGDRFDLTLECIRRHYLGDESPLSLDLRRYRAFFDLFGDFSGYVEFFFFQDLVDAATGRLKFYLPFDEFGNHPIPQNPEDYALYLARVQNFGTSRAERMIDWLTSEVGGRRPGL